MCLSSIHRTVERTEYDLGQRQRREHDAAHAASLSVGSTCGETATATWRFGESEIHRTTREVLEYARECKRQRPQMSAEELRAFLKRKFIRGVDPLQEAVAQGVPFGLITKPLDWLRGLSSILRGVARLWTSGRDSSGIRDIIDGVVIILRSEPGPV
jgi:hypothetical protein